MLFNPGTADQVYSKKSVIIKDFLFQNLFYHRATLSGCLCCSIQPFTIIIKVKN